MAAAPTAPAGSASDIRPSTTVTPPSACRRHLAAESTSFVPVRVAKARPGHVHPAICVAKGGDVLIAHYAEVEGQIFICRSTDGGRTWGKSVAVPDIGGCKPYPGALTTRS